MVYVLIYIYINAITKYIRYIYICYSVAHTPSPPGHGHGMYPAPPGGPVVAGGVIDG